MLLVLQVPGNSALQERLSIPLALLIVAKATDVRTVIHNNKNRNFHFVFGNQMLSILPMQSLDDGLITLKWL